VLKIFTAAIKEIKISTYLELISALSKKDLTRPGADFYFPFIEEIRATYMDKFPSLTLAERIQSANS
jgi:hypothetical protein